MEPPSHEMAPEDDEISSESAAEPAPQDPIGEFVIIPDYQTMSGAEAVHFLATWHHLPRGTLTLS